MMQQSICAQVRVWVLNFTQQEGKRRGEHTCSCGFLSPAKAPTKTWAQSSPQVEHCRRTCTRPPAPPTACMRSRAPPPHRSVGGGEVVGPIIVDLRHGDVVDPRHGGQVPLSKLYRRCRRRSRSTSGRARRSRTGQGSASRRGAQRSSRRRRQRRPGAAAGARGGPPGGASCARSTDG